MSQGVTPVPTRAQAMEVPIGRTPVIAASAVWLLTLLYFILAQRFDFMAYQIVVTTCIAVFVVPLHYSLAIMLGYAGFAGVIKDITNYTFIVHLSNDLVLVFLMLGVVVRVGARGLTLSGPMPMRRSIILLFGSAALLTFAPWTTPIQALGGWKAYVLPMLLVPVAAVGLRRPGTLTPLIWTVAVVGILNAGASFFQAALGPDVVSTWGPGFLHTVSHASYLYSDTAAPFWRPFGFTQDAATASLVEAAGTVGLVFMAFTNRRMRVPLLMAAALTAAATVASGVRASTVVIVVGVVFAVLLSRVGTSRVSVVPLVAAAALAFAAFAVVSGASPVLQNRVGTLSNVTTYQNSRGYLITFIPNAVITHPLGVGMGKTVPASGLLSQLAGANDEAYAFENMFLGMTYELGVFGLVWMSMIVGTALRAGQLYFQAGRADPEVAFALLMLFVVLATGFAGSVFVAQPSNLMAWIFAGCVLGRQAANQGA